MLILGIESSCDETAAAVLADGTRLLSDVVNSQIDIHERFGGVVPEIASRQHLLDIYPVVDHALLDAGITLDDLDGIAVTQGPGLIGSLLVGYCFAKSLAMVKKIPYIGVDHLEGHLLSIFLAAEKPEFPYLALIASGGHSSIFQVNSPRDFIQLGRTRDDAAGEAFDKVAKLLGLGYPGGPAISRAAINGNPAAFHFPRAWLDKGSYDFSFSGLKTSVANCVNQAKAKGEALHIPDICASFQEAVVEVMVEKTLAAALELGIHKVVLAGGVAANQRLRDRLHEKGTEKKVGVFIPPSQFCTDNGAMIALAGSLNFKDRASTDYGADVYSRSQF